MAQTNRTQIAPDRFTDPRQSDGTARDRTVTLYILIAVAVAMPFVAHAVAWAAQ